MPIRKEGVIWGHFSSSMSSQKVQVSSSSVSEKFKVVIEATTIVPMKIWKGTKWKSHGSWLKADFVKKHKKAIFGFFVGKTKNIHKLVAVYRKPKIASIYYTRMRITLRD